MVAQGRADAAISEAVRAAYYIENHDLDLDTVLQLVETGEIERLQEWCEDLIAGAPEYAAFARRVRVREHSTAPAHLIARLNSHNPAERDRVRQAH